MMPFFPADWILDTADLSPEAYVAYHRLLCHMWLNRSCALPEDHQVLRRRAGFSPQKWPHIWREIAGMFCVEDGQVYHQRLSKERGKARDMYAARSQAGRKGADAKWRKNKDRPHGKANGKRHGKSHGIHNHTGINTSAREARGSGHGGKKDLTTWEIENIRRGRWIGPQPPPSVVAKHIEAGDITADQCRSAGVQIP